MLTSAPRRVVITGAATGIGWATARRFAATGDRVAILDRNAAAATARAAELGDGHFALPVDVADEAALVRAIRVARDRFGGLDVLVNNAAVIDGCAGPILDLEIAAFRRLMAVNVLGADIAAREAAAIMQAQGTGGAIVNVASLAGVVAVPDRTAYCASKAAVIGLTRALAKALAGCGMRVNAVLPGFVATETYLSLQRDRGGESGAVERNIPLGRLAEPDEIAATIHHLASTDTGFTTGTMLTVDGGFQAFGGTGDASVGGAIRPAPRSGARVALISGAGSAVGAALAARLADSGTRLVLFGRDHQALVATASALPPETIVMAVDVIDQASADAAAEAALASFGRIDLLLSWSESGQTALASALDEHVIESLIMARACAPAMIRQGNGAIVVACDLSDAAGRQGDAGRSAAREAMAMLTRSAACEWAPHGVRVNAVQSARFAPSNGPALASGIAAAIDFLGSDAASYITGATYVVDGGAAEGQRPSPT